MTTLAADDTSVPTAAHAAVAAAPRGEIVRFLVISALFCSGLFATILGLDALLGRRNRRDHGRDMIGSDVYEAIEAAKRKGARVETAVLGDSVARQFFHPRTEPREDVRYVTSNYAIAVAGQYYLLERVLSRCQNLREVDVLLVVGVWSNDLGPPFSDDYFCGHFHTAAQVAELWRLKKDLRLSLVHASRWLLPNLLGENAARRPQGPPEPPPKGQPLHGWLTPVGGEPVIHLATKVFHLAADPQPLRLETTPAGEIKIPVSRVSAYYLAKMRRLCEEKGVRLRVLPGPCPDVARYDGTGVYDGPILYVDPAILADGIHVRPPFVDEVRARLVRWHHLDGVVGTPPGAETTP